MAAARLKGPSDTAMACCLCGSPCDAPLLLGDLLQKRGVKCHHYCMLFSHELPQRGRDEEGLQGFRLADIRQQVKKCSRRKCHYCRRHGAHSRCSEAGCNKRFHISCAIYSGALPSFFGRFDVHCSEHRPHQQQLGPEMRRDEPCGICLGPTGRLDGFNVLCTPCCSHSFHRLCLQKMALSSGYFFTCPICRDKNNRTGFLRHMKKFGVFVPQRDASWETEPNAFSELLEHHSGCDQRYCLCSQGRKHIVDGHSDWGQLLCGSCASRGAHRVCAGRPHRAPWFCPDCEPTFCCRRSAAGPRPPTLRQLLMSEQRPATALSLPAILGEEGELDWQKVMSALDDPRELLRFTWDRNTTSVMIRTRSVQDPKNAGHVIMRMRLRHKRRQLQPRVLLSTADRGQAEQAALQGGRIKIARNKEGARRKAAGRPSVTSTAEERGGWRKAQQRAKERFLETHPAIQRRYQTRRGRRT